MVANFHPAVVADAFVKQYYHILMKSPENIHKFYQDQSIQGWPGSDGVMTPATTLKGINDKVMASDFKHCTAEVKTTDAQESVEGGMIVAVTGCLVGKDNVKRNFSQAFFLAKQERGFYVLNDILRVFDICKTATGTAPNTDHENDQPAATEISVPCSTSDNPPSLDTEASVDNGKVGEVTDMSASDDTLANTTEQSVVMPATDANKPSVVEPAEKTKAPSVDGQAKKTKALSVVEPAKNTKAPSVVAPAKNTKVPSVFIPAPNVTPKITYASMLARETPVPSPTTAVLATSNVLKQKSASPTMKSSSPFADVVSKVSTPSSIVSKPLASPIKVAPKSPAGDLGSDVNPEIRGIYIGGLPYNITKQGVVDVVKKFGTVKRYSDCVQIIRHEDGFCCGFVEFESADSAHRAVEAHHVMFGNKTAYMTYKRTSSNRVKNGRGMSPTRRGNWNGDFGGARRRSSSSDQWTKQSGCDRLK